MGIHLGEGGTEKRIRRGKQGGRMHGQDEEGRMGGVGGRGREKGGREISQIRWAAEREDEVVCHRKRRRRRNRRG